MNDILKPIIDALTPLLGADKAAYFTDLYAKIALFVTTMRIPLVFINAKLQEWMTRALAYVAATPETDDDAIVFKVLDSKIYRLFAFCLNGVASIKLPNRQTFEALIAAKTQPPTN